MLVDPFTIAAASPTPQLVFGVIRSDGYGSERVDTGGNGYKCIINHQPGKNVQSGNRHYMQIAQTKNATNPYTTLVQSLTAHASLAIYVPPFGYTDAEMIALVKALTDTLADSEVTTARILQNQS